MRQHLLKLFVLASAASILWGQAANADKPLVLNVSQPALASFDQQIVPSCIGYTGWSNQTNPQTDAYGLANTNFPEASFSTYFSAKLNSPLGTVYTVHGRYPYARFMSLEITTGDMLLDYVNDAFIVPDPGQNNPFVTGTDHGTFTAYVVFGPKPDIPAPNTIYTGTQTAVGLAYRMYHITNPKDPSGGVVDPVTPEIWLNGQLLNNCPVQPLVNPPYATAWGRLALADWHGTPPTTAQQLPAASVPQWSIHDPSTAHYFPNGANYYMGATLSRQFMVPNTSNDIFVVRFKSPTFPNTRAGDPVYAPRQVRFWSFCTDDPYTTNANRCIPDDAATKNPQGYVTFVVSDPSSKPSDASLATWYANWVPWGALDLSTDVAYDRQRKAWGLDTPVHYYNSLIYRQTLADPSFTQSMIAINQLPVAG